MKMAKIKNKRKVSKSSENIQRGNKVKKINPFEVHINKEKLKVLGKKLKNERGLPGVSRQKALSKRKHTLQQEYKLQHKSNIFLDKRIGERDTNMTNEDRFIARYAKLQAKRHKKSIFNLADEETLTHKGQTLTEIEKFDDPRSDDDDSLDEGKTGKLDANFVEEAHFGGGVLRKTHTDGAKTHKDFIDQLIADSKIRKAEKQKLKEETLELTEKLDAEWKDLLPLVSKWKSVNAAAIDDKPDEYDKTIGQLKFEARGTPSDRLKTEDEIAKEEKEKLEMLEKERLERMHGFTQENNVSRKHISADDLDDNFVYDSDPDITLSYNKEGIANVGLDAELNGKIINTNQSTSDTEDDIGSKNKDINDKQLNSEENNEESSVETEESESEDNLSDLKEDASESESESESNNDQLREYTNTEKNKDLKNEIRDDLLKRKEIMDKARQELPYTYKVPDSYETLQNLLQSERAERQYIIMERMIKCNHPGLGEANKESLNALFAYLLQYISDVSSAATNDKTIGGCFQTFMNLVPHIFDLSRMNVENAHKSMVEVIKEKQLEYKRRNRTYPGIDTLLFLKLVSGLFPTSDFRHMVVTPSVIFIDQMLNNCKVRSRRDISYGLFLATLVLEYTTLSQRFLPSAINFLAGILHLCIPKTGIKLIKVPPPFKSSSNTLVLFNNYSESDLNLKMELAYLLDGEIHDEVKVRVFYTTLCLLEEFLTNFKALQSNYEIFIPIQYYLEMIPINNYPEKIREKSEALKNHLISLKCNRSLEYLVMAKRRPKALRMYEPNIEKIFDTKRHKVQSKEKAERDKLLHKIKRERKGAMREIRRDKAFLATLKINQQLQSDNERKNKVRKLLAEASMQQSELNAMDRQKKRKK